MSTTSPALWERTEALRTVEAWIEEHADEIVANGGALTPELEALLNDAQGEFTEKAERVALYVLELQADAKKAGQEAARLASRQRHFEHAAKSLKHYLQRQLEQTGMTSVKTPLVSVRVQASPPSLVGELSEAEVERLAGDPDLGHTVTYVPARYELNRRALLDYAKAGKPLPEGLAVTQGTHLRVG